MATIRYLHPKAKKQPKTIALNRRKRIRWGILGLSLLLNILQLAYILINNFK